VSFEQFRALLAGYDSDSNSDEAALPFSTYPQIRAWALRDVTHYSALDLPTVDHEAYKYLFARLESGLPMKHFRSIDGVRAWLAWFVVVAHVGLHTGAQIRVHFLQNTFGSLGPRAVQTFIIISGFVITHLLLERREPYLPYITRRFLRIYPIYFVCLCFGIVAMYLHFAAFADRPWGDLVPQPDLFFAELNSLKNHGVLPHLIAHLLLLHGAISDNVLQVSQFMFLGPAWSLSLEWQFYLVAPLVLYCLRTKAGTIALCVITLASYVAYTRGYFGTFFDPSFLPGAAPYFAAGIATRFLYARLPQFSSYPVVAVGAVLGFGLFVHDLIPVVFWVAFIAWLRVDQARDRFSWMVDRVFGWAFNSPAARYLGIRSYSTYLIHEPIIHIIVFICIKQFAWTLWPTVALTFVLTIPLTFAASVFLYRYVEAPAIEYGKKLFREVPQAAAPVT
jgi:peptidoglycan/LPS O-acetylase OafA/YrhL